MPLDTIASAMPLTKPSLMLHANLFQLFQPIGGVGARPAARGSGKSSSVSAGGPLVPPPQAAAAAPRPIASKQSLRMPGLCSADQGQHKHLAGLCGKREE